MLLSDSEMFLNKCFPNLHNRTWSSLQHLQGIGIVLSGSVCVLIPSEDGRQCPLL